MTQYVTTLISPFPGRPPRENQVRWLETGRLQYAKMGVAYFRGTGRVSMHGNAVACARLDDLPDIVGALRPQRGNRQKCRLRQDKSQKNFTLRGAFDNLDTIDVRCSCRGRGNSGGKCRKGNRQVGVHVSRNGANNPSKEFTLHESGLAFHQAI